MTRRQGIKVATAHSDRGRPRKRLGGCLTHQTTSRQRTSRWRWLWWPLSWSFFSVTCQGKTLRDLSSTIYLRARKDASNSFIFVSIEKVWKTNKIEILNSKGDTFMNLLQKLRGETAVGNCSLMLMSQGLLAFDK